MTQAVTAPCAALPASVTEELLATAIASPAAALDGQATWRERLDRPIQ